MPNPSGIDRGRFNILLSRLLRRLPGDGGAGGGGCGDDVGRTSDVQPLKPPAICGRSASRGRSDGVGGAETTVVAAEKPLCESNEVPELDGGIVVMTTSDCLNFGPP